MNVNMKKRQQNTKQEHPLLGFLKKTRAGKYAKIDQGTLRRTRMEILRQEDLVEEDTYYYSTR
jgi:hypothetical protein